MPYYIPRSSLILLQFLDHWSFWQSLELLESLKLMVLCSDLLNVRFKVLFVRSDKVGYLRYVSPLMLDEFYDPSQLIIIL